MLSRFPRPADNNQTGHDVLVSPPSSGLFEASSQFADTAINMFASKKGLRTFTATGLLLLLFFLLYAHMDAYLEATQSHQVEHQWDNNGGAWF